MDAVGTGSPLDDLPTSKSELPFWARGTTRWGSISRLVAGILCIAIVVVPVANVVLISILPNGQLIEYLGRLAVPRALSLGAYATIFANGVVVRSLVVSIGITIVGTAVSMVFTTGMAYGLSVEGLPYRKTLLMIVLMTFLFSPGIIPLYLVVSSLHLINSYWALILPGAVSTFNLVVLRNFFMSIPQELIDSAQMDGAGYLRILLRIVLPLSKPVLAVVGLFYAVGYWDAFFNALLYLNDNSKWPIQLVLQQYVVASTPLPGDVQALTNEVPPPVQSVQMAVVVVSLIPIMIVYPFLQRYFVKGVLSGAIKG